MINIKSLMIWGSYNYQQSFSPETRYLPFVFARYDLKYFVSEEIFLFCSIDVGSCCIDVESQRYRDGCNL